MTRAAQKHQRPNGHSDRREHFKKVLRHTPEERLDSVMYEFNATLDPANAEIPEDVRLAIPEPAATADPRRRPRRRAHLERRVPRGLRRDA